MSTNKPDTTESQRQAIRRKLAAKGIVNPTPEQLAMAIEASQATDHFPDALWFGSKTDPIDTFKAIH